MKIKSAILIITVLLVSFSIIHLRSFCSTQNIKFQPTQIFKKLNFSNIEKIIEYESKFYVLESSNHRILVFDLSERFIYQISKIGQGKGELFYPRDFIIKGKYLYVHDQKNNRVQIFDLIGKYINDFPDYYNSYGIGVDSTGKIYLGQPIRGKLVSVYAQDGKLISSFGDLHKFSDFYGSAPKKMDKKYENTINRVNMYIDRFDNIFLSFVGAPFFQKYDQNGNLIFEKIIIGPETDEIIEGFKKIKKSPVRRAIDDIPIPLITTGIIINEITGCIIIPFQWNQGWLYIADSKGNKIVTLAPNDKSMLFQNIASTNTFDLILPRLSTVKNNESYLFNIEKFIRRSQN